MVLYYLGHPAHFHLFKSAILSLPPDQRVVCIKSKDVLEKLLISAEIEFINVDEKTIKKDKRSSASILFAFFLRIRKLNSIISIYKPDRLMGSAAELAILGRLRRIPSLIFFEDDFTEVKQFALFAGPFATYLICPHNCNAWKWEYKKYGHHSYQELAYLHPDHFTPDPSRISNAIDLSKRNYLIRFSALGAYHDKGVTGITDELALKLINILARTGNVHITSERPLPELFEKYKSRIPASEMHHALYFCDMYIGDSQTMTAEAAVLGTPALRYNDFVGRLSYLEELEHAYQLTKGYRTGNFDALIQEAAHLTTLINLKDEWKQKREKMLSEKINFATVVEELSNCPVKDLKSNLIKLAHKTS